MGQPVCRLPPTPTLFAGTGSNSTHDDGDQHRGSRGQPAVQAPLPPRGGAVESPARPRHCVKSPARSRSPRTQRQVVKSSRAVTTGRHNRAHAHGAAGDAPAPSLRTVRQTGSAAATADAPTPHDAPRGPRRRAAGQTPPLREQGSHRRATTPLPCTSTGPPRTGATHRPSSH